jgi:hypothetical protein
MSSIAEREKGEGMERKEKERLRDEHMVRIEERLERLERLERRTEVRVSEVEKKAVVGLSMVKEKVKEVEKWMEGAEKVESRVKELEEKVVEEKEQNGKVGRLEGYIVKLRLKEREKEMEGKVRTAMCGVKVGNFNIEQETDNKVLIVRKVLGEVRKAAKKEEAGQLDRVLRTTRVVVLGKRTEVRREGGETIQSVPILLQCQDRKDAQVVEGILKGAGYFPTLHWPEEMMEFIKGVREEVRRRGVSEKECWIRIRPVEEEGRIRIRVDTKSKTGGKFRLEGVWRCPPLKKGDWEEDEGLYTPL